MTVEDDSVGDAWRASWSLRSDTIYLNHGSFGPPPDPVRQAQLHWKRQLDEQPMDFFVRRFESAWHDARRRLAAFIGSAEENLVFVENATYGMNVVANSVRLSAGDEVLMTDHEYGAVIRIWSRACQQASARIVTATLPLPAKSADQIVAAVMDAVTPRTRIIVLSHVTSPTAIILPVDKLCLEARRRGVPVCVDGPHAPLQVALATDDTGCDYYVASCHKWLSAPFGSGYLWVAPHQQASIRAPLLSWGRLLPDLPQIWSDEFLWMGTRDPSPYLSIPAALDFIERIGAPAFRQRTHALAQYARQQLIQLFDREPLVPDDPQWYGSMAHVPLPPGDARSLQNALWQRFRIEVPIVDWNGNRYIRVSCHLYNDRHDIDRLVEALKSVREEA